MNKAILTSSFSPLWISKKQKYCNYILPNLKVICFLCLYMYLKNLSWFITSHGEEFGSMSRTCNSSVGLRDFGKRIAYRVYCLYLFFIIKKYLKHFLVFIIR